MSRARELTALEASSIEDQALAARGEGVLAWTRVNMPLLAGLRAGFEGPSRGCA
ncbi:hypothetical protein BH18ACT13_BH18ACT13_02640 [soil metagenome]